MNVLQQSEDDIKDIDEQIAIEAKANGDDDLDDEGEEDDDQSVEAEPNDETEQS
jgi:hypothetical protein